MYFTWFNLDLMEMEKRVYSWDGKETGIKETRNSLSLKSKLDLMKLWSMINRSRKARRKNIRKGDMVLLWKRPPGRRDIREDTLEDVCKFNNLGSYMNKRSNEMFENCSVVFDVRSYYIILPICAILQKHTWLPGTHYRLLYNPP